jgi:tRNA splicing endonuclease
MNLKELDSFKISDAITFHDKLNTKLWNGTKLRPEVKQQLEAIADDFLQEMGIHELDVRDITISGSNAAYSYTDHSDLDLHILVNVNDLPRSDVYKELFQAKKTIYNDTHDITIHKVPVELYVQDANEPVISLGEYSIKNDSWIKIPTKRRSNFDQNATKAKHAKLLDIVERAIESNNLNKIQKVLKKIKQYRQAGLDKGGEFGPENLAYKALRSQGYITKLYDLRDKLHSQHLTIENMYQDPIGISEASGYIPSEKEKNDPRFKTALTVDVKPDSIKKNAKSFYWNTSRAGIPPTANTNGKV